MVVEGVITSLSVEGILELNGCNVHLSNRVMERDNQQIHLSLLGKFVEWRLKIKLSRSEVVIQDEVLNYDSAFKVTGIIEPSEEFHDRGKALVGKTVVTSNETVPVSLLNISDNVQVLNVGTLVGYLIRAEAVS